MPGVHYQVKRCHTSPADTAPCCHQASGECGEVKVSAPAEVKVASCGTCDKPQPRTPLIPRPPTVRRVDTSAQTGCCAPSAADKVVIATPRPMTTTAIPAPPTDDCCGPSRDHFHRPSPRLVKSVQPPRPSSRPCSCTCHSTAVRRHMTPQATPTSYLAEAEARQAASVCGGDLTTRSEPAGLTSFERQGQGQGELCWRCKLQQCYQCGLELPDPKTHRQPVLRVGRLGAPWRHVRGVTTSTGVYYSFVDGVVKTDDARYYPPYGYIPGYMQQGQGQGARRPICLCGGCQKCVCAKKTMTSSSYYNHAKSGMRYWFDDNRPKPKLNVDCGHYRPRYLNTWC